MSREIGFLLFRVAIPLLLLSIQLLLCIKTNHWIQRTFSRLRTLLRVTTSVMFIAMDVALIYVMIARPHMYEYPKWFIYSFAYPFFIWHGTTLFIGFVLMISMLLKTPFRIIMALLKRIGTARRRIDRVKSTQGYKEFDSTRRTFIRRSMYGLTAVSFGATTYGILYGKSQHEIIEREFVIKNLPLELNGFTICLISDIHSSINMQRNEMEEYAQIVNSLQCDMILITGDFVNSLTDEVYPLAEAFSALRAPHGVFGVMGNHDYFAPEPQIVAREVESAGIRLLFNDKVKIEKNGGSFYLVGIDDVGTSRRAVAAIDSALKNAVPSVPKIVMIHRPYFLEELAANKVDIVFSGHTHGGQVVLGQFGSTIITPASFASKYIWGPYSLGNTQMYVNRGIGTVGLPIRINCPPEITTITLRSQPTSDRISDNGRRTHRGTNRKQKA